MPHAQVWLGWIMAPEMGDHYTTLVDEFWHNDAIAETAYHDVVRGSKCTGTVHICTCDVQRL